jgi:hypothetical protein
MEKFLTSKQVTAAGSSTAAPTKSKYMRMNMVLRLKGPMKFPPRLSKEVAKDLCSRMTSQIPEENKPFLKAMMKYVRKGLMAEMQKGELPIALDFDHMMENQGLTRDLLWYSDGRPDSLIRSFTISFEITNVRFNSVLFA